MAIRSVVGVVGIALAVAVLSAGCDKAVQGLAVRDPNEPAGKILAKSDLADLSLSVDELNDIMGAGDLAVTVDRDELNDNSESVSDPSCVGAAYGAQESVYGTSGYTAVLHQILREPGESNEHWVEQVVVMFPTGDEAKSLLKEAKQTWEGCVGSLVTYDNGAEPVTWDVSDVTDEDSSINQMSRPEVSGTGGCQHSMAVAANVIAEAWACGNRVENEATSITDAIVGKIDDK